MAETLTAWRIWCRVSGGVTGTREAFAKDADGIEQRFATFDAAEAACARLRALRRDRPGPAGVRFEYRPVPLPEPKGVG